MFFGGLNGDDFVDESDFDYGGYSEGPYYRNRPSAPKPVTCYRCGCQGLYWKDTDNGWRLKYGADHGKLWGKLHACDIEGEPSVVKKVNHFNALRDVIDMDGFDYAFEAYSNWEEIDDPHFHTLRLNYLSAMQELADYVDSRADEFDYDE